MRGRTLLSAFAVSLAAVAFALKLNAQMLVSIETVTVGDAGNAPYGTGYGSVDYEYSIGKFETTIGQYATFLNSVAAVTSDPHLINLWIPQLASDLAIAGIERSGSGTALDPFLYSPIGPHGLTPSGASSQSNRPVAYVSWLDGARFANWLHNGATMGADTETGAYTLNGATSGIFGKNPGAKWWIPSRDEWHKAAYYKGGGIDAGYWLYPTKSDEMPGNDLAGVANQANYLAGNWPAGTYSITQTTDFSDSQNYLTEVGAFIGSPGPYGTFDQGGNLSEWTSDVTPDGAQVLLGGMWNFAATGLSAVTYGAGGSSVKVYNAGFRLATVPEPSTVALLIMTAGCGLWMGTRRP